MRLDVVAFARLDKHVDEREDGVAAALVEFGDQRPDLLDLLLVQVDVGAALVGVGDLVDEGLEFFGDGHRDSPCLTIHNPGLAVIHISRRSRGGLERHSPSPLPFAVQSAIRKHAPSKLGG